MNQRVVVQCSGGVESTTLIAQAISEFSRDNVFVVSFNTNSVAWRNRDSLAVQHVLRHYQLQHQHFEAALPNMDFLEFRPDQIYGDIGFIPGYKLFFNIASLAYAQRVGASLVWVGNMADNIYPDATPNFLSRVASLYNDTYACETGQTVSLVAPFQDMSKGDVINLAVRLGVDLKNTFSCADTTLVGMKNCGSCSWCLARRRGFIEAGVTDPTIYTGAA